MKRFFFNLTLYGFLVFLSCEKPKTAFDLFAEQYTDVDFHLTGGKIIDGTGEPAMKADLLIKGDEIVFIGEVDSQRIKIGKTISAKGMVITPGFIDPHSHGDPLKTPEFTNFLAMGVTSISLGQDGFSPDYIDLNPWIKVVDSLQTGPNIIPFIGHGTLRELSGVGLKANPDENDILKMIQILQNGLEVGCWGMTTGLEYTPGRFASVKELESLARVVGEYDGIIMSHVRNEDDDQIEHSIRELLNQGKFCRVQVSHLKSVYGKGQKRAEELLALLNTLPVDITFVDRHDKVKYFSQGAERIFQRNRAILNRDVRMCHPPSSVNIVDQIVDDFKSGRQDSAPFWIQMKGQFIHIEYFAMRNEIGEYLGTLEVSQNLTKKRALEGEQRILSYGDK